jgi:hypothetical protein
MTGAVVDASGFVLPGVKVSLAAADAILREVVTGDDGRFVFDGLKPGLTYVISAGLTGFISDSSELIVTEDQTRTIGLKLYVGCVNPVTVWLPDLDHLLSAGAIAHVRIAQDRAVVLAGNCGLARTAVVVDSAVFSGVGLPVAARIVLAGDSRFAPDHEYVLFLTYYAGTNAWFAAPWTRDVVARRIRGASDDALGIPDGMPVEQALTHLRELRDGRH